MSEWQKGDMALCVDDSPCAIYPGSEGGIRKGAVYSVMEVRVCKDVYSAEKVGLRLDRHNPIHPVTGAIGYQYHGRFIKVTPDAETLEDRGVIEIMKKDHSHVD